MKRKIAALILSCISLIAFSQESDEQSFNGWGFRAALDVNIPGKWSIPSGEKVKMYKAGVGLTAGMVYNLPIAGNFYFEPGASLFYDTYKIDDFVLGIPNPSSAPETVNPEISKAGFRVPLNFGYRFNISNFNFALYTGPELSYAFYGHMQKDDDWNLGDEFSTNLFDHGYRRFDCGWKVGLSFPLQRWVVAVEGTFGLIDQHKNDIKFHDNRLSVVVGYDF